MRYFVCKKAGHVASKYPSYNQINVPITDTEIHTVREECTPKTVPTT